MRNVILGEPLLKLASVDSTNSYAVSLLRKDDVTEGTVILADHQSHGKGQGGNRWFSDAGLNLLFSIILKPVFLMAERQFYLSMCISLGMVDYFKSINIPAFVKWPNDILLNRKKVAGILIENTVLGQNLYNTVVGIGLNVNQKLFHEDLPIATSLSLETGRDHDISEVLNRILYCLNLRINTLYAEELIEIRTAYLNNLWLLNEWARFSDHSGFFEGRIADITETGELVVIHRNGQVMEYGFKEIVFPL